MASYTAERAAARYADAVGQFTCELVFEYADGGGAHYPLPTTLDALQRKLDAVFAALLEGSPRTIDAGVAFALADQTRLVAAGPFDGTRRFSDPRRFITSPQSDQQRRAADMLSDGLELAERTWLDRKRAVWLAARTAERNAAQLLLFHLLKSRTLADAAEQRYVGNTAADARDVTQYTADFMSLSKALVSLQQARESADVDALRTQQSVMQAAALGAMALSVMQVDKLSGGVETAFSEIKGLAGDAAMRAGQANVQYLATMRELARAHPILTALQHHTEGMRRDGKPVSYSIASFQRDVRSAIAKARKAIAELQKTAMTPVIPVQLPSGLAATSLREQALAAQHSEPPNVGDLIASIEQAAITTVWKLPFFMDRSVEHLTLRERRWVLALQRHAVELTDAASFARTFAMIGCEATAALAPLAGPIGIAIAVAWGLHCLHGSVREYEEVRMLYDATLDPAILLRGDAHDPADPSAVILDLVGLLTV